LRALGHEVIAAFEEYPGLAAAGVPFDVRVLWRCLPAPPDLLLVADMLGPQALPFGLEDVPAPRLYYAIDVHVNFFWQRHYARLFDLVLVATERIDNGLLDLFTPGEHLAVYGPDDLVPQVAHYVRADAERARVAANGAQAVRERHTLRARMAALSAAVEAGIVRRDVAA